MIGIRFGILASLALTSFSLTALAKDSAACHVRSAELQAEQASLQKRADARLDLLASTEAAGETWEDAEIHRLASAGHAAKADTAKTEYEGLKAQLRRLETTLQTELGQHNQSIARYNRDCTKK